MFIANIFFHRTITAITIALYITLFLGADVARGMVKQAIINPEESENPALDRTELESTEDTIFSYIEFAKEIKVKDIFHFVADAIKKTNDDSDLTAQDNTQQDSEEKDSDNSRFKLWNDLAKNIDDNLTLMDVIASTKNIPTELATPLDDASKTTTFALLSLFSDRIGDKEKMDKEEKEETALLLDESFMTRMTFKKDNQTLLSINYCSPNLFKGIKCKENTESEKQRLTEKAVRENMEKYHSLKIIQIQQQHRQFRDLIIGKHGNKKNNQTWEDCKPDKNSFIYVLSQDPERLGNSRICSTDVYASYGALDLGMFLSFISGFVHFISEGSDRLDKEESENSEPKDKTKATTEATTEETEKTASCSEDTKEPKNIGFSEFVSIGNGSFNPLKNGEISLIIEKIEHKETPRTQDFPAATGSDSDSKEPDSKKSDDIHIATISNQQQILNILTLITTKVACKHLGAVDVSF